MICLMYDGKLEKKSCNIAIGPIQQNYDSSVHPIYWAIFEFPALAQEFQLFPKMLKLKSNSLKLF